jgi:anti-anti-sigma factor
MKVELCSDRTSIVCSLVGDLDRHNFVDFAAQVARLIRPSVHIAFDLSNLRFIDTSGLRALRTSAWRIRRGGGQTSVRNLPAQVASLLLLARIDEVISVDGRFHDVAWWPPPAA